MTSPPPERSYDALLLDLDGTLVTDAGCMRPRSIEALRAADAAGVRVLVATGRSEGGTKDILRQLGLPNPAVIYNGAGVWCPVQERMLEERLLSNRLVEATLGWAREAEVLAVVMRSGAKFARKPQDPVELSALRWLEDMHFVEGDELPTENLMRITLFTERWSDSVSFLEAFRASVPDPAYMTHFPLDALVQHRNSPYQVVDVQPPCRGKGEALRWLQENHGIAPERVVAVGDANNDVPMLEAAGLGVAMGNAFPAALEVADRIIGDNNTDTIADLVEELFLGGRSRRG